MRKTRFWTLSAAALALALMASGLRAQTATPAPETTVSITVVGVSTRLAIEAVSLPLANQMRKDFARAGHVLTRTPPAQAQILIQLEPQPDDRLKVTISPTAAVAPKLPSPVLMPITTPLTISALPDTRLYTFVSQTLLALRRSSFGDCTPAPDAADILSARDANAAAASSAFYAGNCALMTGNHALATARFHDALSALTELGAPASDRLVPAVNLAWTLLKSQRGDEAFALLGDLLKHAQASGESSVIVAVLSKRSELYALDFRFADAIADAQAAVALAPDEPSLYVALGQRILLTYEWDQVLAAYDRAIEIDPAYAPAYFARGVLYYTEGPRAQALEDFERYLILTPDGEHAAEAARYVDEIVNTDAAEIQQGR